MSKPPEDLDFLEYQRAGSSEALARVFDALAPRLLLVASHFTKDANLAEDLVQTTFLQAMRDVQRYDARQPVAHWLAAILRHRAMDAKRKAGGLRTEEWQTQRDDGNDPARLAEDQETFEEIVRAINELPTPFREVLLLRIVHGIQPTAIAHTLGRSPSTVRMQLKRGLERLRRTLPEQAHCLAIFALATPKGLHAVRQTLLSNIPTSTAVGAPGTTLLTGVIMKKTILAIGAILLLAIPIWQTLLRSNPSEPDVPVRSTLGILTDTKNPVPRPNDNDDLIPARQDAKRSLATGRKRTSLSIHLLDDETGRPIQGIPVGVARKGQGITRPSENEIPTQTSGPEGRYQTVDDTGSTTFFVTPGVELRYATPLITLERDYPLSPYHMEISALEALKEGEARSLTLRLRRRKTLPFFVRFVDGESGAPIGGVTIHEEGPVRSGVLPDPYSVFRTRQWRPASRPLATSDALGLIQLEWHEQRSHLFEVHAPGYGPCWVETSRNSVDRAHATDIALKKSATLSGNLSAWKSHEQLRSLAIGICAFPRSLVDGKCEASGSEPITWFVKANEQGNFEIPGLPSSGPITFWIESSGEALQNIDQEVRLLPGERRILNWAYEGNESIEGILLDANGNPESHTEMWILHNYRGSETHSWIPESIEDPDDRTQVDMAGRFRFEGLKPGIYLVGPKPTRSGAGYAMRVEVPTQGLITVQAPALSTIRGIVRCNGLGVSKAKVSSSGRFDALSSETGAFEIKCYRDQSASLFVHFYSSDGVQLVCERRVSAQPGEQGVELTLVPAASVHVEAVHSKSKMPLDASFSINPLSDQHGRQDLGGTSQMMTFSRLRPGRHVVWAHSANGRAGYTDVLTATPGQVLKPRVIHLQAAGTITLECPTLPRSTRIDLIKDNVRINSLWAFSPSESFSAPAGTYKIEVVPFESGTILFEATVEVIAGKTSTLRVTLED